MNSVCFILYVVRYKKALLLRVISTLAALLFQLLLLLTSPHLHLSVQNMVSNMHNAQYIAFDAGSRLSIRLSIIIYI